jgi:hypothetical protein
MEEVDRTYQRRVAERAEAMEETESVFEPRATSTEKKKVK